MTLDWRGIDHVQLAIPPGAEPECRAFYIGVLGFEELAKPASLAARGGAWLRAGPIELHLGVEKEFRPALKAHPCFVVSSLDPLAERLTAAGSPVLWDEDIPGRRRFFSADPLGNRLEFVEP